jgi:hypothetical protein
MINADSAAIFLAASLLIAIALCIISVAIVFINNVFCRFWIPIKWLNFIDVPVHVEVQVPKQKEEDKTPKSV